jgi:ribosomal protein L32
MAKKSINKTPECLNCGEKLQPDFHFCPQCGQKNQDSHMTFKMLITDFLTNYFSLDSRFGHSIKPFFLQPGTLTLEFINGRRMNFANPIRLYLVISLLHFFLLSLIPDSANDNFLQIEDGDGTDSTGMVRIHTDEGLMDTTLQTSSSHELTWMPSEREFALIYELSENKRFTQKEIEDSLKVDQMIGMRKFITKKIIRLQLSDIQSLRGYMRKNIPILMFILLPVYGLILKLFFRKRLYIHHLIHSIHLHSFMFIMLSLVWVASIFTGEITSFLPPLIFTLLCVYVIISFRKNYELSRLKATLLVFTSGALYSIVLVFGLLLEVLISILLF